MKGIQNKLETKKKTGHKQVKWVDISRERKRGKSSLKYEPIDIYASQNTIHLK